MFVGHYSASFLAKAFAPAVPLWTLLLAVQLVDVAWAVFVLAGIEHVRIDPQLASNPLDLYHMPYTHGLVATVVWAAAARAVARRWLPWRGAAAVSAAVGSHWILDLVVHRPDLPLLAGPPKLGLALWNRPLLAYALEVGLLVASVGVCLLAARVLAERAAAVVAFGLILIVVQTAVLLGPVPSAVPILVSSLLVFFVVVAWAGARVERRRTG